MGKVEFLYDIFSEKGRIDLISDFYFFIRVYWIDLEYIGFAELNVHYTEKLLCYYSFFGEPASDIETTESFLGKLHCLFLIVDTIQHVIHVVIIYYEITGSMELFKELFSIYICDILSACRKTARHGLWSIKLSNRLSPCYPNFQLFVDKIYIELHVKS